MVADSKGDIQRGLEVVEFCCGLPHVMKGEHTQGAGPGIDVWSMRQPIGIGAGITPFNFPAMIPLWMGAMAIAAGNRVQAMGGAKNHGVVMPDADLDQVVNDLCGAAYGSAGERCMALPVVVPVGEDTAERLRAKLIPAIHALKVGISTDPEAHYGPVVTAMHKAKIEECI